MDIPWKTLQSWQDDMVTLRARGCLVCLVESIRTQHVPQDVEFFCVSEFTMVCPRHAVPTLPWREFMLEFLKVIDYPMVFAPSCEDPAREAERVMLFLKHYYESGALLRVMRAHVPR